MSLTDHLHTPRDFLRYAISRFNAAGIYFGHGAMNALDEAAYIVLEGLRLPIDKIDPFLDARLLPEEGRRLAELIEARVETRKPAAYLLNKAYVGDVAFYVDERVIVPRSFIGELFRSDTIIGEEALLGDPFAAESVLDLCTGSGCLAILAAMHFPAARIDAVDLSPHALAVARRNVAEHGLAARINLVEGDLFAPLARRRYDIIISNPPYVSAGVMAELPAEFRHEPAMALAGGEDGFAIVRRILDEAGGHLNPGGALICEIGEDRDVLERDYPDLPFLWLDTAESAGEVFHLPASALTPARRENAPPGKSPRRQKGTARGATSGAKASKPQRPRR